MSAIWLLIVVLFAAGAAWLWGYLADKHGSSEAPTLIHERFERPNMPAELQTAQLLLSEKLMWVEIAGESVSVKPDQVYQTTDAKLIPVETKSRNRVVVYDYDRIELSVQRWALVQKYGEARVSRYGYVRVVRPGQERRPFYIHVKLLSYEDLEALTRRWKAVVTESVVPNSQSNARACRGCGFRLKCSKSLA